MSDDEFLDAFCTRTLPAAQFNHHAHVRLAWLHLQRLPFDAAVARTCAAIKAFAEHAGAPDKFHWTITETLMHLMRDAGADDPTLPWHAFALHAQALLSNARAQLARHYSDAALEAGRACFVAPDRLPLPA